MVSPMTPAIKTIQITDPRLPAMPLAPCWSATKNASPATPAGAPAPPGYGDWVGHGRGESVGDGEVGRGLAVLLGRGRGVDSVGRGRGVVGVGQGRVSVGVGRNGTGIESSAEAEGRRPWSSPASRRMKTETPIRLVEAFERMPVTPAPRRQTSRQGPIPHISPLVWQPLL